MLIYMSTIDAPDFVVSIYNPSFFATDTATGLTTAQATALFLSKSSPDTATALTTFTAGISTNDIDTTTLASTLAIGSSSNTGTFSFETTGQIDIGATQTAGVLNIGNLTARTGDIRIGNGTGIVSTTIGSSAATSTTTIRNPIMNLSYTTTPTYSSSQIGYRIIKLNNLPASTSTTSTTITQWQTFSLDAGVWMFEANLTAGTGPSVITWYISPTTAILDTSRSCSAFVNGTFTISRMSGVIVNSTTANWYLNGSASIAGPLSITAIYLYVTRIA